MAWSLDARIPVFILPDAAAMAEALAAGRPAAVLGAGPLPEGGVTTARFEAGLTGHAAACACCQGRSPAAQALDGLFQARVRGHVKWFDRVLVLDSGSVGAELRLALREDALASARFRLG